MRAGVRCGVCPGPPGRARACASMAGIEHPSFREPACGHRLLQPFRDFVRDPLHESPPTSIDEMDSALWVEVISALTEESTGITNR